MKQSWQLIRRSMNTRKYHAHMGIRTCIQKYQNGNRYVPGQQTATRYHKTGLMDKHRLIICMPWSVADQSCMANKSIKRSISHEFTYVRPPPKPISSCLNQFRWLHCLELRKWIPCLFQNIFKTEEVWKLLAGNKSGSKALLKMWLWNLKKL